MNKPVTSADLVTPKVTTGPLPASRKVYSQPEAAADEGRASLGFDLTDPE
jgi:phosphomethylpyrimidine synthase